MLAIKGKARVTGNPPTISRFTCLKSEGYIKILKNRMKTGLAAATAPASATAPIAADPAASSTETASAAVIRITPPEPGPIVHPPPVYVDRHAQGSDRNGP